MLNSFIALADASETTLQNLQGTLQGIAPGLTNFLPIILIMVVFYFLMIRPQQKKAKEHQMMLEALTTGDQVFINGFICTIVEVDNGAGVIIVELGGNRVKAKRDAITEVLKKTSASKAEVQHKKKRQKLETTESN